MLYLQNVCSYLSQNIPTLNKQSPNASDTSQEHQTPQVGSRGGGIVDSADDVTSRQRVQCLG